MMPAQNDFDKLAFLKKLRERTADSHRLLETTSLSKALLNEDVTLKDYADYLLKMKGVIRFYDDHILPIVSPVIKDAAQRKKSHLIEKDLKNIGVKIREHALSPFEPTAPIQDFGIALGYAYVIEGSTLGGKVILKHILPRLPITENSGASYFNGYGNDTGAYWKIFLDRLGESAEKEEVANKIIEGAQDAFNAIFKYFEQPIEI